MAHVGIINVPAGGGLRRARRCWQIMADHSSIFGVNETLYRPQKVLYAALAKRRGFGMAGLWTGPNPVFFDKRIWSKVHSEVQEMHGRGPGYAQWPGFNERRYVTEVVLQHRDHSDRPPVMIVCSHFTARGPKVDEEWRQTAWRMSIQNVSARIAHGLSQGMVVYFIGDTNMSVPVPFTNNLNPHWLESEGVDKIAVFLPKGWEVHNGKVRKYPAPTDHNHGIVGITTILRRLKPGGR